ncbi:hypothetical protein CYMTET_42557 [Cymbomonas tetramitiformis]|uniref:Uncharacterized protein n=1 Tax=Cymbomonas tetramitiformis TaxID=36881 RepID=A0AAE0C3Y3_9CHLO|nr:hypothetical protein CYMTET_42557 [Cymbomonas tetramitiformis]
MAPNAWRTLKDVRVHDAMRGSVRCAPPPFHELESGATWSVCRPVEDVEEENADGEVSDEWERVGPSVKGLTLMDGTEDTHYFWALRAFVAELEAKFLMKGTKEKQDLLVAKSQTADQDGMTFVKICWRRQAAVHAGKVVEDEVVRQNINECIKLLRIKEYRERVAEQVRVQYPTPSKITWKDLEVIVEVQDKLKNDAETWSLSFIQDITRRKDGVAAGSSESPKKQGKEVNYAEKTTEKKKYKEVSPPAEGKGGQKGMQVLLWG